MQMISGLFDHHSGTLSAAVVTLLLIQMHPDVHVPARQCKNIEREGRDSKKERETETETDTRETRERQTNRQETETETETGRDKTEMRMAWRGGDGVTGTHYLQFSGDTEGVHQILHGCGQSVGIQYIRVMLRYKRYAKVVMCPYGVWTSQRLQITQQQLQQRALSAPIRTNQ